MAHRGWILVFAIGCGSGGGLPAVLPEAGVEVAVSAGGDVLVLTPDAAPDAAPVSPDSAPDTVLADLAPAKLTFDRAEGDFGVVFRGCDPSRIIFFRLMNAGGSASGPVAVDLTSPFVAAIDGCSGQSLAAGASCEIQVQLQPGTDSLYTGMLLAQATPGGQAQAALKGSGAHGDSLALTPNSADFGPTSVGLTSLPRAFSLKNNGDRPLMVNRVEVSTPSFIITRNDCGGRMLPPSSQCEIQLAFKPESMGGRSALLTITASGCGGGTIQANLYGTGIDGKISASPAVLSFGSIQVGAASPPLTATIATFGTPIRPFTAVIAGQNQDQFAVESSTCASPPPPYQACDIKVVFRPTSSGDKRGELVAVSNLGATVSVSLYGSGI